MYDIIGDIHGYADQLENLLVDLGYSKKSHGYKHPSRKVIFVGDFVDASQHLAILRRQELVSTERDGKVIWYSVDDNAKNKLIKNCEKVALEYA